MAYLDARHQHIAYVHSRELQDKPVVKSIGYFYDDSQCTDQCQCLPNFNDCYTTCGGNVTVDAQCVAFCKHMAMYEVSNQDGRVLY